MSGSKFCVMSGNGVTGQLFVASGSGRGGGDNGRLGSDFLFNLGATVSVEFFSAGSVASGNAKDALHLLALLIAISLCMVIRVGIG